MKKNIFVLLSILFSLNIWAIDNKGITFSELSTDRFALVERGIPTAILIDESEDPGVVIAANNLQADFARVSGNRASLLFKPEANRLIIVGTLGSRYIRELVANKKIDETQLKGKNEKYLMTVVDNPLSGVNEALVIAGGDKRGTIYGIYELSEQIGVSPWYDWADVPVEQQQNLSITHGSYTAGEPAVKYRGIFLNDEAPCLTGWVYNTYSTKYGDHRFYARVFELILRLRGNFLWPAMWSWSFYADDPENSKTANEMGIIMGTSHHEPMARNHQEWARKRKEYGVWDYNINQKVIDKFFREGIERAVGTEDLITIGMRGDGDTPMGGKEGEDDKQVPQDEQNVNLLKKIIKNQRQIIKDVTGKAPEKRPQVWAIYKEVQRYYDMGLRAPDDVIMLLCDDNWGNVRRLPNEQERKHPGGWGMYYHVDYVGAPRNYKWLNVTPIQNLWEQMQLTYGYGVDKLWVLNVGDLKPMEYPITLFLDMAWNPKSFTVNNLLEHTRQFCAQQFGENQADEAARILNLYSKYNGRVTPEMLDRNTYNVETGEWKQVSDEYCKLEMEALRQYFTLKPEYKDAYKQLILFPVQAMSNLYEMYYAQAMNHKLYKENNPQANEWADKVEETFKRDAKLCREYNETMSNGKWKGMMTQKKIGYTSWNDNFPKDTMPEIFRIENPEKATGGYIFTSRNGVVSMEAEHYFKATKAKETAWTTFPYMGRTLSGVALMPYTESVDGASLLYRMQLPQGIDSVTVHVIVKSTLAFHNPEGHRYSVGFTGCEEQIVNFNADLNESPQNVYSVFYPTVARRVVKKHVKLKLPTASDNMYSLVLKPLEPSIVFEKIVIDLGGYQETYLFMNESPNKRATMDDEVI
ncbi:glycosyl hydrolase 115 family protein [Dysgonomonas macrotermitis]|uniref:Glycosyl hydrolase family 67 N-terminus n=1 Tax=Dysgonomonas macrotermitis TaxID=1346286 RepID=A0A1M5JI26_9BACT|nr:glycosyl hydrolase 115 family protein [Dysgonomonas macrotermitis]SHG39920.1 Glycosyl hydrolase family 67 N-terminus [Dysgonomonas macrotermitis]